MVVSLPHQARFAAKLLGLLIALSLFAAAEAAEVRWPSLPKTGFISGRPATEQDVAKGNAIFVARVGKTIIGRPVPITIPQYAYWRDEQGRKIPVVIVQAEDANKMRLFGFRNAAGKDTVATGPEIELLGTTRPK